MNWIVKYSVSIAFIRACLVTIAGILYLNSDKIQILSISSGELIYKGSKEECNEYLIKMTQEPNNQANLLTILSDLRFVNSKEILEKYTEELFK